MRAPTTKSARCTLSSGLILLLVNKMAKFNLLMYLRHNNYSIGRVSRCSDGDAGRVRLCTKWVSISRLLQIYHFLRWWTVSLFTKSSFTKYRNQPAITLPGEKWLCHFKDPPVLDTHWQKHNSYTNNARLSIFSFLFIVDKKYYIYNNKNTVKKNHCLIGIGTRVSFYSWGATILLA